MKIWIRNSIPNLQNTLIKCPWKMSLNRGKQLVKLNIINPLQSFEKPVKFHQIYETYFNAVNTSEHPFLKKKKTNLNQELCAGLPNSNHSASA